MSAALESRSGAFAGSSMGMGILRWFLSGTIRQAIDLRRQVKKILNHQRDVLSAEAIANLKKAVTDMDRTIQSGAGQGALKEEMTRLEKIANENLKPYPSASMRENVEVILVAVAIALGVRTFFLQPFKIPTGSMQPTLYGITSENMKGQPGAEVPSGWARVKDWFYGISYIRLQAEVDGELQSIGKPSGFVLFNLKQEIVIGGQVHTIWSPPDYGSQSLESRAGVRVGQSFRKGDDVVKMRIVRGDHLFVDRLTYNFRRPTRGEIIVFATRHIQHPYVPQDQFYIKRLVGLSGEHIEIQEDRHVYINGGRLDANTPRFENVYSFSGSPKDSHYSGHVNFGYERFSLDVPKNRLVVMGDNTVSSLDSRAWGSFPLEDVIGKSAFVYWPLSERFGWSHR
jgi:signal peptidase I